MPPTLKSARVYLRRGYYLVHPLASSSGGAPTLFISPVAKLAEGADAAELGEAVSQALKASRHNEPWPTNWKGVAQALFDAAGVKTESSFMKGAKGVRIDLGDNALEFIPSTSKIYPNAGAAARRQNHQNPAYRRSFTG